MPTAAQWQIKNQWILWLRRVLDCVGKGENGIWYCRPPAATVLSYATRCYDLTWSQAVGANSLGYYGHIVRLSARCSTVGDAQPIAALTMFGCIYDEGNRVPDHAIRKIDNVVTEHNGLM